MNCPIFHVRNSNFHRIVTFSSVRSNDIKPKLRPENKAEKHRQQTIMIIASHRGKIISVARTDSHGSVP